jgi:ABC-type sugar transport system substrate-binding protein
VRAWLVVALCAAVSPSAAATADCSSQAAALVKDEAELPRIGLVSPIDRPPYCITLETIMAFAGRVKAHVAQCPTSDFAQRVSAWDQTRTDYAKLFGKHRCRRTL